MDEDHFGLDDDDAIDKSKESPHGSFINAKLPSKTHTTTVRQPSASDSESKQKDFGLDDDDIDKSSTSRKKGSPIPGVAGAQSKVPGPPSSPDTNSPTAPSISSQAHVVAVRQPSLADSTSKQNVLDPDNDSG